MNSLNPFNYTVFDYRVISWSDDLVTIQVEVPSDFVQTLPALLGTLSDSMRLLTSRVKVARAQVKASDPAEIAKRVERKQQYEAMILDRFDKYRAAGANDREAVRQTRDYFKSKGLEITSFVVELIARECGRFRKKRPKKENDLILSHQSRIERSNKVKSL